VIERRPPVLALLGLTPLVPIVALVPGGKWLLPLVAPLALWPSFAPAVRRRAYGVAFGAGLVWAVLFSSGVILLTELAPQLAGRGIVHAEPYRIEMFAWVESGVAPENDWHQFLPQHLLHLGAFVALTAISGGYLGLVLGAGLTAYMSYFVGSFALASGHPWLGAIVAWVPWSVIRVLAFIALGTILARPMLAGRVEPPGRVERRWLAAAALGLVLDVAIKASLAPTYGLWLRSLMSGAGVGVD
jgi:hypothetical protein